MIFLLSGVLKLLKVIKIKRQNITFRGEDQDKRILHAQLGPKENSPLSPQAELRGQMTVFTKAVSCLLIILITFINFEAVNDGRSS